MTSVLTLKPSAGAEDSGDFRVFMVPPLLARPVASQCKSVFRNSIMSVVWPALNVAGVAGGITLVASLVYVMSEVSTGGHRCMSFKSGSGL